MEERGDYPCKGKDWAGYVDLFIEAFRDVYMQMLQSVDMKSSSTAGQMHVEAWRLSHQTPSSQKKQRRKQWTCLAGRPVVLQGDFFFFFCSVSGGKAAVFFK